MREQCFQIVLSGRVENADKRGYRPDDKNDYTRADHRGREQVHIDARDAIDIQIQITPESNADTLLVAAGCALGSHPLLGSSPALTPKPKKVNRKTSKTSTIEANRA